MMKYPLARLLSLSQTEFLEDYEAYRSEFLEPIESQLNSDLKGYRFCDPLPARRTRNSTRH